MVYIAVNKIKGIKYYSVIKSKREGDKITQEVIAYLGSEKALLKKLGIKVKD